MATPGAVSHADLPIRRSAGAAAPARSGLVLAVVLVGTFMAVLDASIVNVAIPSIRADMRASFGDVELVVSAYTLTYACLLVTGGRLGDLHGRRRLFILGVTGFAGASALCGAAPSVGVLEVARALQGIGAALMYPQVLAIIQVTFTGGARARALGVFGSVIGIAAIAGQLVGGVLLAANIFGLQWRAVFLVNIPLGVLTVVAALIVLPDARSESHQHLDAGGVALVTIGLLALSVPLLEGRDQGWPVWMLVSLACAPVVLALFVVYERWVGARSGSPLVRVALFRNKGIASGVPIALLFIVTYSALLLLLAVYLQVGLGFSPLRSGLIYTPLGVGFFVTSLIAPRLVPLLGRHVLSIGYVIAALGLLGVAATAAAAGGSLHGWELAPPLLVYGLGAGLGMSPLIGTIIAGLEPADAGAGAGIVTTTLQTGLVLGVALGGLFFFTVLGDGHSGASYASAFAIVMPAAAGLLVVAAVLVQRLPLTPFEAQNALIERLPGWASGYAYSMFLMTGGRIGQGMFDEILSRVIDRRLRRIEDAPQQPGDFFAFHFEAASEDGAWVAYLAREGLTHGTGPIPCEAQRLPVIRAQVDEIRKRQQDGIIAPDLDPKLVRLLGFALASYPSLLPQITRMTTGKNPDDPRFVAEWAALLRRLGDQLAVPPRAAPVIPQAPSVATQPGDA